MTKLKKNKEGLLHYGSDVIKFNSGRSGLLDVCVELFKIGKYSRLEKKEDGKYHSVPNDGRHHVVTIDTSKTPYELTFHYTSSGGQDQLKEGLRKLKESLESKVEVIK